MTTGRSPLLAAVDTATGPGLRHRLLAGVTVLDVSRCDASATSGCSAPLLEQAVGSQPYGLAIDQQAGTA